MSQTAERVIVAHFRNYERFETELSPGLTIVVGPNATGKTNLIEAIQLVTAAESFRKPKWEDVVARGAEEGLVRILAREAGTPTTVEMRLSRITGRSYSLNDKKVRSPHDILGRIPCIVFSPDDLYMIKGPAEERRRSVDEAGDQLSTVYAALRKEYARVIRQRNAVLRRGGARSITGSLDELLVDVGARLTAHRVRLARRIAERASQHHRAMSDTETLEIEVIPSWSKFHVAGDASDEVAAAEALKAALAKASIEEEARGMTLIGPHRDDLRFLVAGEDARKSASQGQQRTAALAWKLAELDIVEQVSGRRPLLLLDDVMSELDSSRRAALINAVSAGTQTLITTANLDYFDRKTRDDAMILELNH